MENNHRGYFAKFRNAFPWLVRYPFVRASAMLQRSSEKQRLIFVVANHFEPSWSANGLLDSETQKKRLDEWHEIARETGEAIRDSDGTKFRHTNFFPAEQYEPALLNQLAAMQAEGLGEVEIHLHHGLKSPDTAENLRRQLVEFRDKLAGQHKCLSRLDGTGIPMYAFVHGNLALANSCHGKFCGVDSEMKILQDTGCYADMTLPSAPDETQVPVLNKIYECALPLEERVPHRKGISVRVNGNQPQLPLIFTGPLVFNWTRKVKGIPVPRIEDGALVHNQPMDLARLNRWRSARISVEGKPDWVFVKLYCHGFFDHDRSACIGEKARRFFGEILEYGEKSGDYTVHFASAREAFNMVLAAIEGKAGSPGNFRDYRLLAIMDETHR
jgi:hypothetical protein